ncbi:MAG: gamma-glutamylcyclotransferase [Opitutae bacterium]|nr:gamma-glutamylcyclotransferase [Opitutae bacterium]
MSNTRPKLFVYGTLRSGGAHEMARYLRANAEFLGAAELPKASLYLVGQHPGVVCSAKAKGSVKGELFELNDESVLGRLDRYEDCDLESPDDSEYLRRQRLVRLGKSRKVRAWVYEYNRSVDGLAPLANGVYRPHRD